MSSKDAIVITRSPEYDEKGEGLHDRFKSLLDALSDLEVQDEDDYEDTLGLLGELKVALSEAEEELDKPREEAYQLYQDMLDRKKRVLEPGRKARDIAKQKIEAYRERKLEEQREKRKQIEAKAQSDDPEEVQEALEESQQMPDEPTPDVEGVHYRTQWSGELKDGDTALRKLCHAIGKGEAPVELVSFDSSTANKIARQRKREFDEIPGVKSVRDEILVDRR